MKRAKTKAQISPSCDLDGGGDPIFPSVGPVPKAKDLKRSLVRAYTYLGKLFDQGKVRSARAQFEKDRKR